MSLRDNAQAVLERNRARNQSATETQNSTQLSACFDPTKVARVAESDLIVVARIREACQGLNITPEQFMVLTTEEDRDCIQRGEFSLTNLRAYAVSFAGGIKSGRIVFHPATGNLLKHGIH